MYLNVEEVESALDVIAGAPHSGFTELIPLPHATWQQRNCRAIRIHDDERPVGGGVCFIGGVHAREWGSPDILIHFAERLTEAYRTNKGIDEGGASFSPGDIKKIVRNLDVVVFPQVNPDGRHYSMTAAPLWRKNRRPGGNCTEDGSGSGNGVDINRNYDFMWDFETLLSPQASLVVSDNPCNSTYHGPSPASEPETKNVQWLLDQVASVGYFIDIHSFGEWILYPWGDDQNQSDTPSENFENAAWDGQRGVANDAYGEYLSAKEQTHHVELATAMFDGIKDAHGREYKIAQSALLNASGSWLYITTGTADDYAYGRHLMDPAKRRIYGYTLEWGPERSSLEKSFHPDYADMVPIIEEVTAGLLAFCLEVAKRNELKLDISPDIWKLLVYILFGVTNDGGGVVFVPGRGPIPIGPWGPLVRVDKAVRDRVVRLVEELEADGSVRRGAPIEDAAEAIRGRVQQALGERGLTALRSAFVTRPVFHTIGRRFLRARVPEGQPS